MEKKQILLRYFLKITRFFQDSGKRKLAIFNISVLIYYLAMIVTIIFSIFLFVSLWPYLTLVNAFDFKSNQNLMEPTLPGRPARRTIGRKNFDLTKSISAILSCHILMVLAFYGMPEIKDFFEQTIFMLIIVAIVVPGIYSVTASNRAAHAYITLGQLAIVHGVSGVSSFVVFSALMYDNVLGLSDALGIGLMILGAMIVFARKLEKFEG